MITCLITHFKFFFRLIASKKITRVLNSKRINLSVFVRVAHCRKYRLYMYVWNRIYSRNIGSLEFVWTINNIGFDHSKWRSETYRCWQIPHCFLYSLQKYMYMYTHIYFDCVNQESWLDIHVYMLYHIKIVLRLSVPLEPSQDFLEKKLKQKHHFWKVSI